MQHLKWMLCATLLLSMAGCSASLANLLFPSLAPELLDPPPLPMGPYAVRERRVDVDDLGDGRPGGLTLFEPLGAPGPCPALIWVLGVHHKAHYQQSLHEYLASWGYVGVVPDTRRLHLMDFHYHGKNVANAARSLDRALSGELGIEVDPARVAFGGYSVGATQAALAAAEEPHAAALVLWAPVRASFWRGVDPEESMGQVTAPTLFLLGELDTGASPDGWPAAMAKDMTTTALTATTILPQGVHLFFQQPSALDEANPPTTATRIEQLRAAMAETRSFLDSELGVRAP